MSNPRFAEPCHITSLFPELLSPGGVQQAGRMIAAALTQISSRRGWSVELFSLNDPPGSHDFRVEDIETRFRGFGRAKKRFVYNAFLSARRGSSAKVRIVLAAHPNLAVPAIWMQKFLGGLRPIVVCHGIEVWQPMTAARARALRRAPLVIAPSRYTAKRLEEAQGISPERIYRLPWPLDPEFVRLAAGANHLRLPRGFPQGRVILTVGRWAASEQYKGGDQLIASFGRLCNSFPNLHLVVVGNGDDVPRLRQISTESGVAERVHFLQGLDREEVAACYANAEIFALPSTGEGFGLVLLEAMAFAKPVIGAAEGGILDLIGDGINGLLVPGRDVSALSTALARLLNDESLRHEMGCKGRELTLTKFCFEAFRNETEQLFLKIAEP